MSSSSSYWSSSSSSRIQRNKNHSSSFTRRSTKASSSSFVCLSVGFQDLAEIAQNKVLVAATVSCTIGQIAKPFTTALIHGDDLNFRKPFRAGGFPSVHSSGVVAAATSLGLERGFSDAIFGMAVIFAAIVMYDAQAVRLEVGKHAKILNKTIVFKSQNKSITNSKKDRQIDATAVSSILSKSDDLTPLLANFEITGTPTLNSVSHPIYLASENQKSVAASTLSIDCDPVLRETCTTLLPLEESIGHTRIEVIAGALLGFLVTLAVYNVKVV